MSDAMDVVVFRETDAVTGFAADASCANRLTPEKIHLHRRLSGLIQDLIFSGNQSGLFAGNGEALLHSLALRAGTHLVDPLVGMIMAPNSEWSLDAALALVNTGNGDYLARLALLELVCRELGRRWSADDLDFVQVSVGTARLQLIMRSREFRSKYSASPPQHGSLLVTAPPGEDHLFAPMMIDELFRSQGWQTAAIYPERGEMLATPELAAGFDVVCLSWSSSVLRQEALATVRRLREALPLPRTLIIAGGNSALENREAMVENGVDFVCANGYVGLAVAERHVSEITAKNLS